MLSVCELRFCKGQSNTTLSSTSQGDPGTGSPQDGRVTRSDFHKKLVQLGTAVDPRVWSVASCMLLTGTSIGVLTPVMPLLMRQVLSSPLSHLQVKRANTSSRKTPPISLSEWFQMGSWCVVPRMRSWASPQASSACSPPCSVRPSCCPTCPARTPPRGACGAHRHGWLLCCSHPPSCL